MLASRQLAKFAATVVKSNALLLPLRRQMHSTAIKCAAARKFTDKHEWVAMSGKEGTIGLTKHATDLLGEIVFVELPDVGKAVDTGEEAGAVESVKAASDVYSPVAGSISAVNEILADTPSLINKSPYDQGWLFKVILDDVAELDGLMDEAAYNEYVQGLDD